MECVLRIEEGYIVRNVVPTFQIECGQAKGTHGQGNRRGLLRLEDDSKSGIYLRFLRGEILL